MNWMMHLHEVVRLRWLGLAPFTDVWAAIRQRDAIATEIPGLGACRSVYCKPERRSRTH